MYNEEITGHNIDEVICMNRFKWPFKFSSILKSVKRKLKLLGSMNEKELKMPKIVPFAVFIFVFLIGVNSFFCVLGDPRRFQFEVRQRKAHSGMGY